ncbi:hypothetical protein [Parvibaculum sp.]|uniref:hypothetical protein n=1 Tax=Parvibaculum sp. TaxID=2024848 RepID=UPI001E172847|nr:hypothetical protein [Parvibaculum sp.]MBX3490874.1 hypothetical protein [Parvibaculum sp.]
MAKKGKAASGEPQGGVKAPTPGSNGYDKKKLEGYVSECEEAQTEIDEIMQAAKDKCAPLREQIADIKKAANEDDGIPRKEFNAVLQERRLRRKADGVRDKLSAEQQDQFDLMKQALGMLADTPLGQAAMH